MKNIKITYFVFFLLSALSFQGAWGMDKRDSSEAKKFYKTFPFAKTDVPSFSEEGSLEKFKKNLNQYIKNGHDINLCFNGQPKIDDKFKFIVETLRPYFLKIKDQKKDISQEELEKLLNIKLQTLLKDNRELQISYSGLTYIGDNLLDFLLIRLLKKIKSAKEVCEEDAKHSDILTALKYRAS